jgi:hypothetical protein
MWVTQTLHGFTDILAVLPREVIFSVPFNGCGTEAIAIPTSLLKPENDHLIIDEVIAVSSPCNIAPEVGAHHQELRTLCIIPHGLAPSISLALLHIVA